MRRTIRSKLSSRSRASFADRAADVLEQADPLGADRGPQLGRLGDPLDQLLGLLAGQQPAPDLVDQLAVHRLDHRPLDRVALERPLDRLLDHRALEHAGDRPLDRLALDRADDRLLGGDLDGAVDPGRPADAAGAADADAEQPGRERQGAVFRRSGAVGAREWSRFPSRSEYRRGQPTSLRWASRRSRNSPAPAGSSPAPPPRRTSRRGRPRGTRARWPLRGGHSISNVMLSSAAGSKSPSAAQAVDHFAGPLADRAELDQLLGRRAPAPGRAPRRAPAARRRGLLAGLDSALRDRPGAVVALAPEGAAGVDEQELGRAAAGGGRAGCRRCASSAMTSALDSSAPAERRGRRGAHPLLPWPPCTQPVP